MRRLGRHGEALHNCLEFWRSKILTMLASWACHGFMGAVDELTPESEAYDRMLLKGIALTRESAFFTPVPNPQLSQGVVRQTLSLLQKNLELRAPEFCICAASTLDLCPGETFLSLYWTVGTCPLPHRETLPLSSETVSKSALCSGGRYSIYISRLFAIWISLKRQLRTKGSQYLCLQNVQK